IRTHTHPSNADAAVEAVTPLRMHAWPADHAGAYVLLASRRDGRAMTGSIIKSEAGLGIRGLRRGPGGRATSAPAPPRPPPPPPRFDAGLACPPAAGDAWARPLSCPSPPRGTPSAAATSPMATTSWMGTRCDEPRRKRM